MITDLKPYPAMRDSGVPWLGEMPKHWEMKRAKFFLREVDDRSLSGEEELLSVSHKTGVTPRREKSVTMFLAESNAGHKVCRPGDVVVNTMWAWMAALGVSRHEGLVSPSYGVYRACRSGDFLSSYLDELLRTPAYRSEYVARSTGITSSRLRLYPEEFLRIPFLCPPPDEQAAIVRFLGHADGRIRRYVRAKQKLIKLLEEQKQAIIHRAVTRGLNPNVRLKAPGMEWLGDVPERWMLARLKDVAFVQTGFTLGKNYAGAVTESRPYLRVANVQVGRLDLRHVKRVDVPPNEAEGATLRSGDVLMTEGGDIDKLGRGCVWREEIPACLHQNHVFAVRCRESVLVPEFLVGLMASQLGRAYFQLTAKQTTNLASTNSSTLRAFPIVVPPLLEQQAILNAISKETASLSVTIDRAQNEISLLREYRTRLIADVVTGKLDVRGAAARMPDAIDGPEPLDDAEASDAGEAAEDSDLDATVEEAEV